MFGYRLAGIERIGAELASGMGVPPSVKTSKDYHRDFEDVNFGDLLKSLLDCHPGESRIRSGAGSGVKTSPDESREPSQRLDPGFHREPWIPAFDGMTNFM
jgi:hypothetical protein